MSERTVWAISTGSYSDYEVHALFATKELAEQANGTLREWDRNGVTEFTLYDEMPPALEKLTLCCEFDQDGFPHDSEPEIEWVTPWGGDESEFWLWNPGSFGGSLFRALRHRLTVCGFDHERVRRIYSDRRAIYASTLSARMEPYHNTPITSRPKAT